MISKETLEFHYGKHHKAYVDTLNKLIPGTIFEKTSLDETMLYSSGKIFNNAGQAWNHVFYWNSLRPAKKASEPKGELLEAIKKDFGSFDGFKEKFTAAATSLFGSGWTWLAQDRKSGKLLIEQTSNAENPARKNLYPIFTCDVWEHAYYIDYRNARATYVDAFWKIANWDFALENFKRDSLFAVEAPIKAIAA